MPSFAYYIILLLHIFTDYFTTNNASDRTILAALKSLVRNTFKIIFKYR